ncbi:hypothetical protein Bca4012_055532 [Brassica carinata]
MWHLWKCLPVQFEDARLQICYRRKPGVHESEHIPDSDRFHSSCVTAIDIQWKEAEKEFLALHSLEGRQSWPVLKRLYNLKLSLYKNKRKFHSIYSVIKLC